MLSRRIDENVYQSDFEYASSNYQNFNVIKLGVQRGRKSPSVRWGHIQKERKKIYKF